MKICNFPILPSHATAANFNSNPMQLSQVIGFSIQAVFVGTPTGTIKLQASCDPVINTANPSYMGPTNWSDIANTSTAVSAAGAVIWNIPDSMYTWVRINYVDGSSGSSTATVSALANTKGF